MKEVYKSINIVQGEMAKIGIAKSRKGALKYNFRGIDDVYAAIAPLLAEHKLCVLPRVISRDCVERETRNGGAIFYVTLHMEFDFVSSKDGSLHTVSTYGEAMDSSDKATNKAMSVAYKYAAFQTFCIPVEGDNDTENSNHEVKPMPKVAAKSTDGMDEAEGCYNALNTAKDKAAFERVLNHKKTGALLLKLANGDEKQQKAHNKIQQLIDTKRGEYNEQYARR